MGLRVYGLVRGFVVRIVETPQLQCVVFETPQVLRETPQLLYVTTCRANGIWDASGTI